MVHCILTLPLVARMRKGILIMIMLHILVYNGWWKRQYGKGDGSWYSIHMRLIPLKLA